MTLLMQILKIHLSLKFLFLEKKCHLAGCYTFFATKSNLCHKNESYNYSLLILSIFEKSPTTVDFSNS